MWDLQTVPSHDDDGEDVDYYFVPVLAIHLLHESGATGQNSHEDQYGGSTRFPFVAMLDVPPPSAYMIATSTGRQLSASLQGSVHRRVRRSTWPAAAECSKRQRECRVADC